VKDLKKIYQANGSPKQTEVAVLISNKVDFKHKLLKRDKEVHFILMKGPIHEEKI
jgi:hypothetical protein